MNHNLPDTALYFDSVLPWQAQSWQQLTSRYPRLPHGLLFAGMQGIGKRAFVWRFTAWMLCEQRGQNPEGACGHCQSCQWLLAGTHPDLQVLPLSSIPTINTGENSAEVKQKNISGKTALKTSSKKGSNETKNAAKKDNIKIDDIRALQPFISQGSSGRRICVIDNAETMTLAAANALLKTLEEPRAGIHLFIITDQPSQLLPTIKSRVQQVAINNIDRNEVEAYLIAHIGALHSGSFNGIAHHSTNNVSINNNSTSDNSTIHNRTSNNNEKAELTPLISQTLALVNGAPLAALAMLKSNWYAQRQTWLKTWLALRVGKRSSLAASDYWQKILSLDDFMTLSELMLMDLSRGCLGLPALQTDLGLDNLVTLSQLKIESINSVLSEIDGIKLAVQQNVQEKLGYDRLFSALALL